MKTGWHRLTPKPWRKRKRRYNQPSTGPPADKFDIMRWSIDPTSDVANALRALREQLEQKEE
jgi:hypothetical protein